MFDDGSRIIQDTEATAITDQPSSLSIRGSVPVETYYETERTAKEAVDKLDWSTSFRGHLLRSKEANDQDDGFLCRIALQFPDELLGDASHVTVLMEEAIVLAYKAKFSEKLKARQEELTSDMQRHLDNPPLVFLLGDSTYGSCCPDEVSARHLNADVLIHYGYACLSSSSEGIPVVYAFGVAVDEITEDLWKGCVDLISAKVAGNSETNEQTSKLLILYDVRYFGVIGELKMQLEAIDGVSTVILGSIPKQQLNMTRQYYAKTNGGCCNSEAECNSGVCCGNAADNTTSFASCGAESCCQSDKRVDGNEANSCCKTGDAANDSDLRENVISPEDQEWQIPRSIGGLEIPDDLDLTQYTLLYVGDDLNVDSSSGNQHHNTRLFHILLRCTASDGCPSIWSYSPLQKSLNCDLLNSPISPTASTTFSTFLSRTLRRRYFLIQKAKMAKTIGILIGTTTTSSSFRLTLARIRNRIQSTERTAYTFAVGKLAASSSKVSNFAEIDCFVLIACQESIAKFWGMEREDMIVPVLTPLELDVALDIREWDGRYSCDFGDLIRWDKDDGIDDGQKLVNDTSEDEAEDKPFFSMISGKYENSRAPKHNMPTDLQELPGQGQIMEYRSEAAEFLQQREYKGLEANVGLTMAKAATIGKAGIASNYGEDT